MKFFKLKGVPTVVSEIDSQNGRLFITVDVKDLPKQLPMDINPRKQNMKTAVGKQLVQSLVERNPMFEFCNGGMKIVCDQIQLHKNSVDLLFNGTEGRGVFDGGHTYRAIIENVNEEFPRGTNVLVEVIFGQEMIKNAVEISAARNTTCAVKIISVLNALGWFSEIKKSICEQPYATLIRYSENDPQPIKIELLLGIMMAMDIEHYGCGFTAPRSWPTDSYNSKKHAVERFKKFYGEENNIYQRLIPLLPQFIKLYDYLQVNIPKMYNQMGGSYGSRKVDRFDLTADSVSTFSQKPCGNYTPDAYIFPIMSSLRFCLEDDGKEIKWRIDPFDVLDKIGPQVVYEYLQDLTDFCQSRTGSRPGPNALVKEYMKDHVHWKAVYANMAALWQQNHRASY